MRKPEIENFVWAALAWFWFAQFPFMVLIGNDWLFANLPFNWAVLLGLYSIALPFFVAGAVYLFARRRLSENGYPQTLDAAIDAAMEKQK